LISFTTRKRPNKDGISDGKSLISDIILISATELEASVMPTQVQESSHILLNAHKLYQRGLGPCAILELQFQPHPKPLGCVTLLIWEGQEAF